MKQYSCVLHKIRPEENQYRFYSLRVAPTLFGEWSLFREWGRIGNGGTVKIDPFKEESEAFLKMGKLIKEKVKRGYIIK